MKNSLCFFATVVALATAVQAAPPDAPSQPPTNEQFDRKMRAITGSDRRTMFRGAAGPVEMENVTFLGVETAPVSPTLIAQLGLPDGAGLVANRVAPDSPAAGALKEHDILMKLDDQILIDQRQLAVLVRNHKEGDEVTLTYLRGGKQATAKVKLAKHEAPKLSLLPGQPGNGSYAFAFGPGDSNAPAPIDPLLGLMNGMQPPGLRRMNITTQSGGPGDRTINVTVNTGNSHIVLDDDKGSLDLTIKEGGKELVAKNTKGEQIFSGPINTPEERKALPDEVRRRLEQLEDSTQFSFKTDSDFQGAETKIVRPRGQGIAAPLPPPIGRARLFF